MKIRNARETEFEEIYRFVSKCKPLENYQIHFYRIMLRYFGDTCFIAEDDGAIIGFVLGVLSQRHKGTFFLWQIGIDPLQQGKGLGSLFLKELKRELAEKGITRIELTVDPDNKPSQSLFEKNGYVIVSDTEKETVKCNDKIAGKNFYGRDRHFILYEKIITKKATG